MEMENYINYRQNYITYIVINSWLANGIKLKNSNNVPIGHYSCY